jgi:6-phosphogluconolactonase (cycloisomerase 2 family)
LKKILDKNETQITEMTKEEFENIDEINLVEESYNQDMGGAAIKSKVFWRDGKFFRAILTRFCDQENIKVSEVKPVTTTFTRTEYKEL